MQKQSREHRDISGLEQLRKELKVHVRSLKSDMKGEWRRIEGDWKMLRKQILPARRAAEKSAAEVKDASEFLLKSVKHGYARIKRSLPAAYKMPPKRSPRKVA